MINIRIFIDLYLVDLSVCIVCIVIKISSSLQSKKHVASSAQRRCALAEHSGFSCGGPSAAQSSKSDRARTQ